MNKTSRIRVRFAPSPTGSLHIGGLRTALYNFLFARHNNGDFILRIEDTDQKRKVDGAVDQLLRTMKLFGIEPDEGPVLQDDGTIEEFGSFGPYEQSKRLSLYTKVAERLLSEGHAYYCFCTEERLDTLRHIQQKKGLPTKYDGLCRKLTPQEVEKNIAAQMPKVLRLKMPHTGVAVLQDIVRGKVEFSYQLIDDQVLMKSDGFPTYHLANVVDDHEMKITHVIRGEEWLPSVPKHLHLYRVLGWQPPQMAHLPILLDTNRAKLSKRKGAVSAEEYIEQGFLPDALINFMLLLGWNPKTEKEIFSRKEMIDAFSLEQVNDSGASVNEKKLLWMNKEYLKAMSPKEFDSLLRSRHALSEEWFHASEESATWFLFLGFVKERLDKVIGISDHVSYFFEDPKVSKELFFQKSSSHNETVILLKDYIVLLKTLRSWDSEKIKEATEKWLIKRKVSRGDLLWPVRVALTGKAFSPGAYELLGIFDKEQVIRRIENALK
ncbi:MAG: glutamate--tRNA ligase [Patescibacteria group bacterium]